MKKIISAVLALSIVLTMVVSALPAQASGSTPLGELQLTQYVGAALADCVNAGIWGLGTILLSWNPLAGGIAAGIGIGYLIQCVR